MTNKHMVSIALNDGDAEKLSRLQNITLQNPTDTIALAIDLALYFFDTIGNARLKSK